MLKRTPLYHAHQQLGARLVEFGGWEMPVQYQGIIQEHQAVRTASGLFDICHMGEVAFSGPDAEAFLNHLLTNDTRKLAPGQGQYSLMCNPAGGVVDDLYLYRTAPDSFLAIINASRIEPDLAWIQQQFESSPLRTGTRLEHLSETLGAIALQGPTARNFIDILFPDAGTLRQNLPSSLKKNEIDRHAVSGQTVWVACTGYTGEDGFEIVAPSDLIPSLWSRILEVGTPHGLKPAGLGARDTLRTEACYSLYGHELDESTTPLEAGLGFFVALEKGPFIGRDPLLAQKKAGVTRKCAAIRMTGPAAPPRPGYRLLHQGTAVGTLASGTLSPTLNTGIGLGYLPTTLASPGQTLDIEIRSKTYPAIVTAKPFYKRTTA